MRGRSLSATTLVLFLVGMAFLAFADFSIKETSGKISPSLGTLIYGLVAVVPPLLWVLWTRAHEPIVVTPPGVMWAIATGISFGVFTSLLFLLFSQGVDLSIGTPVIRMGGIVVAATLGIIILREGLNWQYVIGFILAAVGILLVATR
jgi:drug/metabolite transporter (DMT)-like permease